MRITRDILSSKRIKLNRVLPLNLPLLLFRDVDKTQVGVLPGVGPRRGRQRKMARPQNIRAAEIAPHPKTHAIVPASEITLTLEQFRRLHSVTLRRQAVGIRLVIRILDFVSAPTERAFREHDFQFGEAVEDTGKKKISYHRNRTERTTLLNAAATAGLKASPGRN